MMEIQGGLALGIGTNYTLAAFVDDGGSLQPLSPAPATSGIAPFTVAPSVTFLEKEGLQGQCLFAAGALLQTP